MTSATLYGKLSIHFYPEEILESQLSLLIQSMGEMALSVGPKMIYCAKMKVLYSSLELC